MTDGDVIFSDEFNHASIIDGCRITKAKTVVYPHNDMKALEKALKENDGARRKMIITDGVFSMEGDTAPLDIVVELGDRFNAIKVVDESHAIGVVGRGGIGTGELYGVQDRIDIFTGTFGKALGGAGGGYLCGSKDMTDYLYHRSRPFIFTNALPPATMAVGIAALDILENDSQCLKTLWDNTRYFRNALEKIGLKLLGGESPIIPVLIGDTAKAYQMSNELFDLGVFITAIGYPVVSSDEARLRVQISASLGKRDLDVAIHSIDQTAQKLGIGKYKKNSLQILKERETNSKPLSNRVYVQLKREILNDKLKLGEPLIETDIAKAFETSRTLVREAFKRLQSERLVTAYPGRGTRVSEVSTIDLIEALRV